jgi:hypothetical protein
MRPRIILLLFGILTTLLSILALIKSISPSILGAAVGDKIESLPSSPNFYFALFLIVGLAAAIIAMMERKVIY